MIDIKRLVVFEDGDVFLEDAAVTVKPVEAEFLIDKEATSTKSFVFGKMSL